GAAGEPGSELLPVADAAAPAAAGPTAGLTATAGEGFAAALAEAGGAAPADTVATAPAEAAAPAPTPARIDAPPGTEAFNEALGAQLHTWLEDGVEYATLELNPQDMGPIDVRIALVGGRTQIELAADVAATREALNDALPGLAEALGDVGLQLSGGSVGDQTGRHAADRDGQAQRGYVLPAWLAPARQGADTAAAPGGGPRPGQRGLVDLVA
uniref:flagellar hook-length control protein FliK n=1 Tax=Ideonella sp. TaxID=1929293 RepID=UPI0035AE2449